MKTLKSPLVMFVAGAIAALYMTNHLSFPVINQFWMYH